jgi:transglycosylase-like protein with SLT domain
VPRHRLGEYMRWQVSALTVALVAFAPDAQAQGTKAAYDDLVTKHATAHGVPEQLVRRVIAIESRGNPKVISGGNYGLMQIRLGTARAMGYQGEPHGLLDADTNLTYAVKYLAGAYRAAGCDPQLAISYYQHGYSGTAKTKCTATMQLAGARSEIRPETKTETKRDAKPADRLATKAEREVVFAPSIADPEAKPPPAPTDVLKAKVVQTLSIPGRDGQTVAPAARSMKQDALPPQPVAAKPDTFAARADLAGVHASANARPSLEPEPVVAPPARKKAEPQPSKRRKARVEPATAEPRVTRIKHKRARDKVEAQAKPSGDLISALKKLVTPEQKQPPARKPRKQANAAAQR